MTSIFFQAAAAGDTHMMLMLKLASSVDPFEKDECTHKTAAHLAAEKGYASVLRLLFNLGDTFKNQDKEGKTPRQYATDSDCKEVFQLVQLAEETTCAVDKVFPRRMDVQDVDNLEFLQIRDKVEIRMHVISHKLIRDLSRIVEEEILAAPEEIRAEIKSKWEIQYKYISYYHYFIFTFESWKGKKNSSGACGETNSIAYTYLNYVKKITYPVECVKVPYKKNNNHTFLILNRSQEKGFEKALVIDAFLRKSFFLEHKDVITVPYEVSSPEILCSMPVNLPPQSPFPQEKAVDIFLQVHALLEEKCTQMFQEVGITE